tara:strand:+ start:2346 stop:4262 length:1917 start_codon:yes stop_codon:yes gene_type:complete
MNAIKTALTIRLVENKFLELFADGKLNGTVHTCVGQEFSAVAFCAKLKNTDYVFSNHRCHGHYIAFTKEYKKLIAELMGKETGVCGGVGGSQHLCTGNFFSNGPQGALTPVATGVALGNKKKQNNNVAICFIGDGTLGEGIVYESLNLASLYKAPILFVCENNKYAQSTPITDNLSGSITKRAKSFGLEVYSGNTWDYENLINEADRAIENSRKGVPGFFVVDTYRLNAHSKGDDDRNINEIKKYHEIDPLNKLIERSSELKKTEITLKKEIDVLCKDLNEHKEKDISDYFEVRKNEPLLWEKYNPIPSNKQIDQIYDCFKTLIKKDSNTLLIGEDIASPYGGAFKATRDLSDIFPENVISTPISEAGIVGMGIGLSLSGYKPLVEIMFGDFLSYSFDQILSNASKFYDMYDKQVSIPLVIRTPMGGGRGYGPTHSQSIEKLFNGINNIEIVALNSFIPVSQIYKTLNKSKHTTLVIENKLDYSRLEYQLPKTIKYEFYKSNSRFPISFFKPINHKPNMTIITYGGSSHVALESIDSIFLEYELIPQIIIPTQIYPINIEGILEKAKNTKYIVTIEESNIEGGFGSEIISGIAEKRIQNDNVFLRIGSKNIPLASTKKLETDCLVNAKSIIRALEKML